VDLRIRRVAFNRSAARQKKFPLRALDEDGKIFV
jgi:hypothetical protein